jgi:hypothetical protein
MRNSRFCLVYFGHCLPTLDNYGMSFGACQRRHLLNVNAYRVLTLNELEI